MDLKYKVAHINGIELPGVIDYDLFDDEEEVLARHRKKVNTIEEYAGDNYDTRRN